MFSHVFVGVRDFDRALGFYGALMRALRIEQRFIERERPWAGWQTTDGPRPLFVIGTPHDQRPHVPGNGQMVAFLAQTRATVDAAHAAALANGGSCEGPPGLRPEYHANYYGAYFRDTEGNKLCVACHAPEPAAAPVRTTRVRQYVAAPPAAVFAALTNATAVRAWKVPEGMQAEIHQFEPRPGGRFRISLVYQGAGAGGPGKTDARTDTYHGHFVEMQPPHRLVERMAFESDDPAMQGEMQVTWRLDTAADGGTALEATHENVPRGVPLEQNEEGWAMAVEKLARWVEGRGR